MKIKQSGGKSRHQRGRSSLHFPCTLHGSMVYDCSSQCSGPSYFRLGVSGNVSRAGAEGEAIVTTENNQQPSGNGCIIGEFPPEMLILPVGFSLMVAIYIYIYTQIRTAARRCASARSRVRRGLGGSGQARAHERKH